MSKKQIILIVVIVMVFAVGIAIYVKTKGYKKDAPMSSSKGGKNNPGNIRASSIQWGGETTKAGDVFESFGTVQDGIKAMYSNLQAYKLKHGLTTIRGIITRWAPPTDNNDTEAYIKTVSDAIGVAPDIILNENDYKNLIAAMSRVENNTVVSASQVSDALNNVA